MNLLAIDTSSNACSVALQYNGKITEKHVVQPREHTRLLMPMIIEVLDGLALQKLDAIVLGNGPGSFIGMRIGASVAQGLAYAAGLAIIPVSSLAAIAAEVLLGTDEYGVVVAQDARMSEVYVGTYRRENRDELASIDQEAIHAVGPLPLTEDKWLAAGGAWERYPDLLSANSAKIARVTGVSYPRAAFLIRLADADKSVPPEQLLPAYLRAKVADKPAISP